MRFFLILVFSLFCAVPQLSAQGNGIEQASELVTVGPDKFLRWHGHAGRTYFIQVSDPNDHLNRWTWAPIIESGNNVDISYEVDGTADKGFFRLKYTDQPTTDPDNDDFDGDSISNINEVSYYNSDPLDSDTDNDGMADGYEVTYYFDLNFDEGGYDYDNDGLTNLGEYNAGTGPYDSDTDGDGMKDGFEVTYLLNPLLASDAASDADSDGLSNLWEYNLKLNPRLTDSNSNGISDALEDRELDGLANLAELTTHSTDPSQPDTDMDTLPDGWELANGFDPTVHNSTDADATNDATADPDGDGLNNSQEADNNTRFDDPDTDGDGVDDGVEVGQGSNPNDPNDSQPPPSGTRSVNVTFGDDSGSHSEKYRVKLTPLEGDNTGHTERFRTNREYGVSQTDSFQLPKGAKYKVELIHIATDPDHDYEPNPDYDHTLEIDTSQACLVVEDPESIMGTSDESLGEEFVIEGKDATLYVPLFEWVTPKASPISAPNDAGDGQNEFTYSAAAQGVLTMDIKVLMKPTGTAGVTGHDGVKFSDRCFFKLPTINGSTFAWDAANPGGKAAASGEHLIAKATYTNLPPAYTDFGLKQAECECDGHTDTLPKGDFEVFYMAKEKNHPGGNPTDPNWYYYYRQNEGSTDYAYNAALATSRSLSGVPNSIEIADNAYNGGDYFLSTITNGLYKVTGASGITKYYRYFYGVIAHERHHANNELTTAASIPPQDDDGDSLSNSYETTTTKTDPNIAASATGAVLDDEAYAGGIIEETANNAADTSQDWANPGSNSKSP